MKELTAEKILQILITIGWSKHQIIEAIYDIGQYSALELDDILDQNISHIQFTEHYRPKKRRNYSIRVQDYDPKIFSGAYELKNQRTVKEIFKNTQRKLDSENVDIIEKIYSALSNNIHLKTSDIVEEFSARLEKLTGKEPPPLSKKSLGNWLERALNIYTKSELLHVATSMSNDRKKDRNIEWSVRNEKKS